MYRRNVRALILARSIHEGFRRPVVSASLCLRSSAWLACDRIWLFKAELPGACSQFWLLLAVFPADSGMTDLPEVISGWVHRLGLHTLAPCSGWGWVDGGEYSQPLAPVGCRLGQMGSDNTRSLRESAS